jgi:hypothetical protein
VCNTIGYTDHLEVSHAVAPSAHLNPQSTNTAFGVRWSQHR